MIAYNNLWLNHLQLHHLFEEDHDAGCLTDAEVKLLKTRYPVGFYMPGIMIRIGLFILTLIIALFSGGLLSLLFAETHIIESPGWPIFLGLVTYGLLELMVKNKYYYQSGVDEALLCISACLLGGGVIWMLGNINNFHTAYITISLFVFVLSLFLTLRFSNVLTTVTAILSFEAFMFFNWKNLGVLGTATLPFFMMMVSALLYYALVRLRKNPKAAYYQSCITVAQVVCLVILYFSGNYFVVKEMSISMMNASPDKPLAFGFIFWIWTILLPFAYIAWGIKKKDSIILRTGLFLIAAAVYTFRFYYHVLPVEVAFTLGGTVLLAVSYVIIKYLKTPKYGFTYAQPNRKNLLDQLNIESLIVGETFSQTPDAPTGPANPFGGGSAGGGGSGGSY